jgi:2-polyprenyl-3-methyl-5-hydroxy-6-metoxy-1,4-benzoquinol methylase
MLTILECPICQSKNWQPVFEVTDHSISKEKFTLIKCAACALVVTSPRPDDDRLGRYYQSDDYISHSGKSNNLVNKIYLQARKISLRWKLNIIQQEKHWGKLLDIGCGTGEFLHTMKTAGWEVSGVEPSMTARSKAEQLLEQTINENLESVKGAFDIITLWHALEHLPDLNGSLEKIVKLLKPDGKLLIAVPNHTSHDGSKYGPHWAGYDVPRHLWHFNQKAMAALLLKHGFTLQKTLPMKLDSYYVSLLSEKYKGGGAIGNLVNGFLSGFTSNQKAKTTGEYSSLIYIAGK